MNAPQSRQRATDASDHPGANPPNGRADVPASPGGGPAPSEQATFGQTAAAVFWSFFGVRKKSAFERDHRALNPLHVVIMGLLAAAVFVGTLVTIVLLVTRHG